MRCSVNIKTWPMHIFFKLLIIFAQQQNKLGSQLQDLGCLLNHGQSTRGDNIILMGGCASSLRTFWAAFLSHEQSAGQNHTIMTANTTLAKAPSSNIWERLTNRHCKLEEITTGINSGNICYHSVPDILPSVLLSKTQRLKQAGL